MLLVVYHSLIGSIRCIFCVFRKIQSQWKALCVAWQLAVVVSLVSDVWHTCRMYLQCGNPVWYNMLFFVVFFQLFQMVITKLLRISLNCCGTCQLSKEAPLCAVPNVSSPSLWLKNESFEGQIFVNISKVFNWFHKTSRTGLFKLQSLLQVVGMHVS